MYYISSINRIDIIDTYNRFLSKVLVQSMFCIDIKRRIIIIEKQLVKLSNFLCFNLRFYIIWNLYKRDGMASNPKINFIPFLMLWDDNNRIQVVVLLEMMDVHCSYNKSIKTAVRYNYCFILDQHWLNKKDMVKLCIEIK